MVPHIEVSLRQSFAGRFANWNPPEGNEMLDIAMIALGVGFFVASILYVLACERM